MFSIAVSSLRFRASAFVASFINVFLGAVILMAFASLLDSAGGAGVSPADKKTLSIMTLVIGGWGLLIVAFGVAATSNLSVRQRSTEIALLKSVGATPRQIGRMIIGEVAIISIVAALIATPVAFVAGRACLASLQATHQVAQTVGYHFGIFALGIGLGDTVVAAAIAAAVAARRAASLNTREALAVAATGARRMSRKRIIFGCLFLLVAIDCGVLTATVFNGQGKDQGYVAMSLAGQACIHTSIGLALFAPALMRAAAWLLGAPLQMMSRASGYLAGINVRQRPDQPANILMPIIMFTGMAAGGLYIQSVLNNANAAAHIVQSANDKGIETLNFIVVAMIAVFAAVVLINITVATTTYRRREFGQERLVGATPAQVLRMVGVESVTTVITGLVIGTVAALAGIVPYSIARTHQAVPHVGLGIYAGVVATAVVVTAVASLGVTLRAMRRPAIEAVGVNT